MTPPEGVQCSQAQLGPVLLLKKENRVSSCDQNTRICELESTCIDATCKNGIYSTKYFDVKGVVTECNNFRFFDKIWSPVNPTATDLTYDMLVAINNLNKYTELLSAIGVYADGLDKIIYKKPTIEVATADAANAFFMPDVFGIFFGYVRNMCGFGGDGDVVVHELTHLLTFSKNEEVGSSYNDIEGPAIHEALSDVAAAIFFDDPQIGESVVRCLGVSQNESPELGLRTVYVPQGSLFFPSEGHARSEMYSPTLWTTYRKMEELLGDKQLAREAMLILINKIADFLPAVPQKGDFVKAFYNALVDFSKDPKFAGKYRFDPSIAMNAFLDRAKFDQLIPNNIASVKAATTFYPYTPNPLDEISRRTTPSKRFEKKYERGNVVYYQLYLNNIPVDGEGIRFVRTSLGTQMIESVGSEPKTIIKTPPMTPESAWSYIGKKLTKPEFQKMFEYQIKMGAVTRKEVEENYELVKKRCSEPMPPVETVYLSGKTNLQYKFKVNGLMTFYIDTVDRSISLSRQKFY